MILNDAVNEYLKASEKEKSLTKIGNKYKINCWNFRFFERDCDIFKYRNFSN